MIAVPDHRQPWQIAQAARCGCGGSDDMCPCQNVDEPWKYGLGSPGAKVGHENREAVRQFFAKHIGCANVECARALGLSVMAVGRHVATLRKEWA